MRSDTYICNQINCYCFSFMGNTPKIYVAIPVMDECDLLKHCIDSIERQSFKNYHVVICVNQPDEWWDNNEKRDICLNNQKTCAFLKNNYKHYHVIDKSAKGEGWKGNKKGVGWARKTAMDYIATISREEDIIVSLDADTVFDTNYFISIIELFKKHPKASAISNPYYHRLSGKEAEDRAILRYEIYMRNYAINLLSIHSPYAYTALGSAMALPVKSYKVIGGMTPKLSGEDFYFLQKLRKYGNIIIYNTEKVFPAARFSDRVFFGTGPAMIKGNTGNWESYPIYHHHLFKHVFDTYACFPVLFKEDIKTPLSDFLDEQLHTNNIWVLLRKNNKDENHFVRACYEKVDGLRVLQYLKFAQEKINMTDETCLLENMNIYNQYLEIPDAILSNDVSFAKSPIYELDLIRNYLVQVEEKIQKEEKQI